MVARDSKETLFDKNIATFDDDGGAYNQADAGGFIKLNALRMRIAANARGKRAAVKWSRFEQRHRFNRKPPTGRLFFVQPCSKNRHTRAGGYP